LKLPSASLPAAAAVTPVFVPVYVPQASAHQICVPGVALSVSNVILPPARYDAGIGFITKSGGDLHEARVASSTRDPAVAFATLEGMFASTTGFAPVASHATTVAWPTTFWSLLPHAQLDRLSGGVAVHAADHLLDLHQVEAGERRLSEESDAQCERGEGQTLQHPRPPVTDWVTHAL
jgi:hypothetical protein